MSIREIDAAVAHVGPERRAHMLGQVTELFLLHAPKISEEEIALFDDVITRLAADIEIEARIVLAQRVRDAAMAQALVDAANASGAVLIAGDGHVRADLGVPIYLHAVGTPDSSARSVSVGLVEVSDEERRANDFPRDVVDEHPGFDYIWFTAPTPREDPCAGM